jgi:hypothetical protein
MANRALLHMNKLKDFESWLEKQGYMILPTSKNPYEILRAKKSKDTVIIYRKGDSKEHLSIMDKDYDLIHEFMMESKLKTNADRIRNMSDEELAEWINTKNACRQCANELCTKESCTNGILQWLKSEAE